MLIPWLLFPLVLAVLALGCGLLLESAAGSPLPRPLLLPAGLALVMVAALFPPIFGSTASLAAPLVVALAATTATSARSGRARTSGSAST